jgi:TonB family protein
MEARMSIMRLTVTTLLSGTLLVLPLDASQGSEDTQVLRVYDRTTPGLVLPKVVKNAYPHYTAEAMRQRIRGSAAIDATVGVDGKVRDVLLVTSVDAVYGLDEEALATAGRWLFSPGTLNGQPVPVRVRIDLAFTIAPGPSPRAGERR